MCPVAPIQNTRPSGRRRAGPISCELACTRITGVEPALTHLPPATTYFSALPMFVHSTARMVSSGRSVQVSSSLGSSLLPVAVQVLATGS